MVTAQDVKSEIESQLPCMDQTESCGAPRAIFCSRKNSLPFQERVLSLDRQVKIGRSVARTQPTPTNGIFDCKVLSRNHAIIWYENDTFYIKDTKSSNGTFVNSQRLSRNGEESIPREIWSGDVVQFGVDVQENQSKVTHGCIIGTLRLICPNGKEAIPSVVNTTRNSPESFQHDEISKLNLIVVEALQREWRLKNKLSELEEIFAELEKAFRTTLASRFAETKLLSKIENHDHRAKILKKIKPGSMDAADLGVVDQLLKDVENVQATSQDIQERLHKELMESEHSLTVAVSDANNLQLEVNYLRDLASKSETNAQEISKKCKDYIQTIANLESQIQAQDTNENQRQREGSVEAKWEEFFTIPIVIHENRSKQEGDVPDCEEDKYTIMEWYEKVKGMLKEKMNEEDFDKYKSNEFHDLLVDSALHLLEKQPPVLDEKKLSDQYLRQTICPNSEKRDISCEKLIINAGIEKSAQTDEIKLVCKETNTDFSKEMSHSDSVADDDISEVSVTDSPSVISAIAVNETAPAIEQQTAAILESTTPAIATTASIDETKQASIGKVKEASIEEVKEASCRLEEFVSTCVGSSNSFIWDKVRRVREVCDNLLEEDPGVADKLRDVHLLLRLVSEDVYSVLVNNEKAKKEQSDLEERLNQALHSQTSLSHAPAGLPLVDRFWAMVLGYIICYIASCILASIGLTS